MLAAICVIALGLPAAPAVAAEQADLELTQTATPDPVGVGMDLTWHIVVANNGPGTATGVAVNDNFNEFGTTTQFVSLEIERGSCTHTDSTFYCEIGTMSPNTTVAIDLTVTVRKTSSITNVGDVSSGTGDPDWGNNHMVGTVESGRATDLILAKTADTAEAAPGDRVSYTLTARNDGPEAAAGVVIADRLPAGLVDVAADPADDCTVTGSVVSCTAGSLTPGAQFTATVTARIDPAFTGDTLVNTATATMTTPDSNPANNTAQTTIAVAAASTDLSVVTTLDTAPVAGEPVRYTLTVASAGPGDAADATLDDTLPATITDPAVSTEFGACELTGSTVHCGFGTVPAGARFTVTVTGTLAPDAAGTLTNTATVATTTADTDPANDTSTAAATIGRHADLALLKTATPADAHSGEAVQFHLRVVNHGPSDAAGVVVEDPRPAGLEVPGACTTPQGTCAIDAAGTVTFALGTVPVGGVVDVAFTTAVAADAGDAQIVNTATVHHDGTDPEPANDTASYLVNNKGGADLSLTKTVAPNPVIAGGTVAFTLTVHSAGPGTATDVTLDDTVPDAVDVTAATPAGGDCTVTGQTVSCTRPELVPGADWTVTVTGTVAADTPPGLVRNTARTGSAVADPTASNNRDTAVVRVVARADLDLAKTGPATVVAGERMTYTLSVANAGPSAAHDVVVLDELPAGVRFVSGGTPGIPCAADDRTPRLVRCTLGTLAPTASPLTVPLTVAVDPAVPAGTTLVNTAGVSSTTPGVAAGLVASASTTVTASADLGVVKLVEPGALVAGGPVAYVIRVHNSGPSDAADLRVDDDLPAGVHIDDALPAGGECTLTADSLVCTRAALADGATWTIVLHGTVDPAQSTPVTNTVRISAGTDDPDPGDDSASATAQVQASADVGMIKTTPFPQRSAGQSTVFFLSVVGRGPSTATDVSVTDVFPGGVIPTAVTPSACRIQGQRVLCAYDAVAPGQVRTAVVTATVAADPPAGRVVNTATVSAATSDPEPGNDSASAAVTLTPVADLSLGKQIDPAAAHRGDTVTVTLTIDNAGPSTARDVELTDPFPAGLVPQAVTADPPLDCAITGQALRCTAAALPVGSSRVRVTARVDATPGTLVNTAAIASTTDDPDDADTAASARLEVRAPEQPLPPEPGPPEPGPGGNGGTGPGGNGGTGGSTGPGLAFTGGGVSVAAALLGVIALAAGLVVAAVDRRRAAGATEKTPR
ncbi:DUF7507 domain-containing protein [Microbacterium luticocti]|uniref:DUF7507 domain-containing protein n=1 Tax=Microbacterium luticocti TaxID=451764 RepID=UPI0004212A6A|nr:DUF11 domain-containing protein [Microbacterium luticocti]